jgi:hypothetical protein
VTAQLVPARLDELEEVIERGLATFIEVGAALKEIRDEKWYRDSHATFEDYCRERWDFNRQRASQLIQASDVSKILDSPPRNDAQARELAPLLDRPKELKKAWAEVVESNPAPTAADIRAVVQRTQSPKASVTVKPSSFAVHLEIAEHLREIKRLSQKWDPSMIEGVKPGQCEKDLRIVREVARFLKEEYQPTVATKGTPLKSVGG